MSEPFLIGKALDITPTALGKSTFVVIKGFLVLLAIAGLGWAIYVMAIKPHTNPTPTNRQEGQRDNYNLTIAPKQTFFGCMRFNIPKPEELKK